MESPTSPAAKNPSIIGPEQEGAKNFATPAPEPIVGWVVVMSI
jgi:hypothetical protein